MLVCGLFLIACLFAFAASFDRFGADENDESF